MTIGENNIILAQTGIAGSSSTGKQVTISGQVGIVDHVSIIDGSVIAGKSLVTSSIKTPGVYSSMIPVIPMKVFWRNVVHLHKLDKHINTLRSLEKRILAIEKE